MKKTASVLLAAAALIALPAAAAQAEELSSASSPTVKIAVPTPGDTDTTPYQPMDTNWGG
jgi:ABC-type glycerol-3-phosphate transport system substrate-binding protein